MQCLLYCFLHRALSICAEVLVEDFWFMSLNKTSHVIVSRDHDGVEWGPSLSREHSIARTLTRPRCLYFLPLMASEDKSQTIDGAIWHVLAGIAHAITRQAMRRVFRSLWCVMWSIKHYHLKYYDIIENCLVIYIFILSYVFVYT